MIKPTVGRVVLYKPHQTEVAHMHSQPFRADICHVFSDVCVNLSINREDGRAFTKTSVMLAQDREAIPGECYWMDYQKQSADKSAAVAGPKPEPEILSDEKLAEAMDTRKYPRVTESDIGRVIVAGDYFTHGTLTICVLTLQNGFKVIGQSACIDPRNFDAEIGRTYARKNAEQQIWALEGYALANNQMEEAAKKP